MRNTVENIAFVMLAIAAVMLTPELVLAQDVFKAPSSFLKDVQTFITGPGGILLAGLVIAAAAIVAASPRSNFNWGQFFIVLIVIAIFFGSFKIAEVLQKANA